MRCSFSPWRLLNELVWRTQSTDFWVSFKVFGLPVLTILFIVSQMPFINRHAGRVTRVQPEPQATPPGAARLRPKRPGP